MPYIDNIQYRPKRYFQNGHISTLYAGLMKRFEPPTYKRESLILDDGDIIALDCKEKNTRNALILCHGLEGNSRKNYNNVCADYFLKRDFSVFAWNNRSCGGVMNAGVKLYHHGETDVLEQVVHYVINKGYHQVYIIGFSLGGAQLMSFLGKNKVPEQVKAGVAISSPYDLRSSSDRLKEGFSRLYLNRFIHKIRTKIIEKAQRYPEIVSLQEVETIRNFDDVIERFVIPAHGGYHDLHNYYRTASPYVAAENIKTPILLINAVDDPILGQNDYPVQVAKQHNYLFLETPEFGGHCAFPMPFSEYPYAVVRAYRFFESVL